MYIFQRQRLETMAAGTERLARLLDGYAAQLATHRAAQAALARFLQEHGVHSAGVGRDALTAAAALHKV